MAEKKKRKKEVSVVEERPKPLSSEEENITDDESTNMNEIASTSKQLVTATCDIAALSRDIVWTKWRETLEINEGLSSTVTSWFDMARTMHDDWLDAYEKNIHQIIDHGANFVERFSP